VKGGAPTGAPICLTVSAICIDAKGIIWYILPDLDLQSIYCNRGGTVMLRLMIMLVMMFCACSSTVIALVRKNPAWVRILSASFALCMVLLATLIWMWEVDITHEYAGVPISDGVDYEKWEGLADRHEIYAKIVVVKIPGEMENPYLVLAKNDKDEEAVFKLEEKPTKYFRLLRGYRGDSKALVVWPFPE
jgi:hypothetical protein